MPDSATLWDARRRALRRAQRELRADVPSSLHDVRVALRRVAATAGALQRRKLARRAKGVVSSLSGNRQLEVDRTLLERVAKIGLLSEDATTALGARWEASPGARRVRLGDIAKERRLTPLLKELRSLAAKPQGNVLSRLLAERAEVESELAAFPERKDDATLHRYRLRVKRARYLAEDLVACGRVDFEAAVAREKAAQETLGRWNDLRFFLDRIDRERELAERRGAVRLASELEALTGSLEPPLKSLRKEATDVARRLSSLLCSAAESA